MIITGGEYNGRKVSAPDESLTRPTLSKVRMGVFNTLYSLLGTFDNHSFLDMFGGSGIMGLEAVSRGFSDVEVWEKNPKVISVIKNNYKNLGLIPNLKKGDSLKLLENLNENFDVIYIDPPYASGIYEKVLNILKDKISKDTIIVAEHDSEFDFAGFERVRAKNYGGKFVSFFKTEVV